MRNLRLWIAAPTRNVEIASTSTVNVLRGLVVRATTPLLRDDYLKPPNRSTSAPFCMVAITRFTGPAIRSLPRVTVTTRHTAADDTSADVTEFDTTRSEGAAAPGPPTWRTHAPGSPADR
jgi:hypothetical protein